MDKNDIEFLRLQQTLTDYAVLTKKSAREIVVEKGGQLIFGSHNKFGNFKGMFDELSDIKPRSGEISADVSALFKAGSGIKISAKSRQKADDILDGESAALFVLPKNGHGKARIVRQITKGKKQGRHTTGKLKNSAAIRGNQQVLRELQQRKEAGEIVLNRQSLAANIEIAKREGGRGYSAAAWLYKRYRKTIEKLKGKEYVRGQLKGVSSVDACLLHEHKKILVKNKTGNALSNIEIEAGEKSSWIRVRIFTDNVGKAGYRRISDRVMRSVMGDMKNYIDRKLKEKTK